MGKIAFLYPGQGAQKAGMGLDFYKYSPVVRAIYEQASDRLQMDLEALCFQKNELLDQTEYTQPALVATCLAMTEEVKAIGIKPDVTAGLSLGEYAAIACAGGMSILDAIWTVSVRGKLMQEASMKSNGGMSAVLGLDASKIEEVLKDNLTVSIANYNCPGQIVITGEKKSLAEVEIKLKEAGAKRILRLNVSGPFHSRFMKLAGDQLGQVLDQIEYRELSIPYIANVTGEKISDSEEIKDLLIEQVSSSVLWQQSIERMIEDGVDLFLEIGPGKTLTNLLKKIAPESKVINISCWDDLEKLREVVTC